MFFARSSPADLEPGRLAALRVSLNAPVVSVQELPSGPARAAIALGWEGEEGTPALEVRLRSVTTGHLVAYGFEEALEDAEEVERALEAALNFAESMGFLFDEDVLSAEDTADRSRVREAWAEFGIDAEPEERPAEAPEAGLLELTELADTEPPADGPAPEEGGPHPAGPEAPVLTKFRGGGDRAAEPAQPAPRAGRGSEAAPRAALGRVPLVRRRRRRRERPGLLLRILGAF